MPSRLVVATLLLRCGGCWRLLVVTCAVVAAAALKADGTGFFTHFIFVFQHFSICAVVLTIN